jgi:hypothetical protein
MFVSDCAFDPNLKTTTHLKPEWPFAPLLVPFECPFAAGWPFVSSGTGHMMIGAEVGGAGSEESCCGRLWGKGCSIGSSLTKVKYWSFARIWRGERKRKWARERDYEQSRGVQEARD